MRRKEFEKVECLKLKEQQSIYKAKNRVVKCSLGKVEHDDRPSTPWDVVLLSK